MAESLRWGLLLKVFNFEELFSRKGRFVESLEPVEGMERACFESLGERRELVRDLKRGMRLWDALLSWLDRLPTEDLRRAPSDEGEQGWETQSSESESKSRSMWSRWEGFSLEADFVLFRRCAFSIFARISL